MKLAHGFVLLGTFTALSVGTWLGCSSDNSTGNPNPDGGTNTDSGTLPGTDTGTPPATDSGTPASDAGTDGPAALTCDSYCTTIMNACQGAEAQYQTKAECLTTCALIPTGTAQTGNTLGCHDYHAGKAVTGPNPHCWHAGPFGYGVCGATCDNFCALTLAYCSPANGYDGGAVYPDNATCLTKCNGYTSITPDAGDDSGTFPSAYNAGGAGDIGNTLECREYHLGNALTGKQAVHCPHAGETSAPCQ